MKFTFTLLPLFLALGSACRRGSAPANPSPDGGEAQRLVAVLDYVGGDYGLAVSGGSVVSGAEYEEQIRFAADARSMAARLLGPAVPGDAALIAAIEEVEAKVKATADPEVVAAACKAARQEVVTRFQLRTMPSERPSLRTAEELFRENCVVCHGTRGDAQTERARTLDPPPASFTSASRLENLSPYRVYNALTFGVKGTAMAAFETLSSAQRWDLAFYVFRLGHAGRVARGPLALSLADMAGRSDREILDLLRAEGTPAPAAALAFARREAPFAEPPAAAGLVKTRRLLKEAAAAYAEGRADDADLQVVDAYLGGFEPLEPRLRARDPNGVATIEAGFRDLRAAMSQGYPPERIRAQAQDVDAQLFRIAEGEQRAAGPFAAASLIFFREGIEAALLVAALLAGLRRLGRADAARFVHAGWITALPAGFATWWAFERILSLGADQRELMEALVALLAASFLFSVSFWMISKAESRRWMSYLKKNLEECLSRRNLLALAGVAFLAVYREAAETVLFTQALVLEAGPHRGQVWAGATVGVLLAAGAAFLMNRTVLRLPLGPFFAVSSLLLCGLAISFAGSGIYTLVASGHLAPRPVRFPEIPWLGIHPDLTGLLVQLSIVAVIGAAGLATLRRRPAVALDPNR